MRQYSRMQSVASQFGTPERGAALAWDRTGTAAREAFLPATRRRTVRLSRTVGLLLAMVLWSVPCLAAVEQQPCWGDCDGTGQVTVDELLTCVNIALGTSAINACSPADKSGDGTVTVDEILTAVSNALNGCQLPTPTGELSLDSMSVAVFLDGASTVGVRAKDESGQDDGWTVTSSDEGVVLAEASADGETVRVSGKALGDAMITVTAD